MILNKFSTCIVMSIAMVFTLTCWANEKNSISYKNQPQVLALIDEMVAEHNYDRDVLLQVFVNAKYKKRIIELMNKPAEGKPWKNYRPIFVTKSRSDRGKKFMSSHQEALLRAEQEFGVPVEIIVAIIGVETRYGKHAGTTRVIDALSTLAFNYPRRSAFFRKELIAYLLLIRDESKDPLSIKGSYAGAMGYGQFMPSSFIAYAVDYDNDGRKDIWDNPTDAIGSVANYFFRHGWVNNQPVISKANFSGNADKIIWVNGRKHLKPKIPLSELIKKGLQPQDDLSVDQLATAMRLHGTKGEEYWIGLHNFYVITRYNHSALYALSVYQLSQKIAQ